jgi:hypothetical protein
VKRTGWWASAALGTLGASVAFACGARTGPGDEGAAVGTGADAGDEATATPPAECSGITLTASSATTLLSVPMGRDPQMGLELQPSLTVAATPAGDRFLVALTQTSVLANTPSTGGNMTVVQLTANGATASPLVEVPEGQAAFDGQDLLLLLSSPQSAGIGAQRVSSEGSLVGSPVTGLGGTSPADLTDPKAGAGLAVTVPLGAAVPWQDQTADGGYVVHASVIGPDLALVEDEVLPDAHVGIGVWNGRTFAMRCLAGVAPPELVDLGWAGEATSTFVVEGGACPFWDTDTIVGQGLSPPLLSTGGGLGLILSAADGGFGDLWLYEGVPGQGFTPTVPLPRYLASVAADSCGRVVVLSTSGAVLFPTPSPPDAQLPALLASGATPGSQAVTLDVPVSSAAIAPTPGGFAVFWLGPPEPSRLTETLKMATLTWN